MEDNQKATLTGAERINPYSDKGAKGDQVEQMFDSIAPAYDFMNTAMTFGLHKSWRSRAIKHATRLLPKDKRLSILDLATGTGDLTFHLHTLFPSSDIQGIDLSEGMLDVARHKLDSMPNNGKGGNISFYQGDCLNLKNINDNSQDLITIAYGVRNFEHLRKGLAEMARVLKPGGVICIIELSQPRTPHLRMFYTLYSNHIIPFVGKMVSHDNRAYSYLPESIAAAPQRSALTSIMKECGFRNPEWRSMTFGSVTYYIATK